MKFCTVISCIDGRIQLPVNRYVQERFGAEYVDTITEAGVNRVIAEQSSSTILESVLHKLSISITAHRSCGIAVVGHYDCAGNPNPPEIQARHILQSVEYLREVYPEMEVIGLWVDENWQVHEIDENQG
ncbi:MAG: hypothetical protein N3D16_12335 [Anaerolineales bacterium]|nr:hypothetical protein [Anaerolineales bacterium]